MNTPSPKFVTVFSFLFGFLLSFLASSCQVFDEADMLLCGSFQNQVIRLINMFRYEEKVLSRMQNYKDDSLQVSELDKDDNNDDYYEEDEGEDEGEDEDEDENEDNDAEKRPKKSRDWRRKREVYSRSKQYVFVAATLPRSGKKTAGGVLKQMFPSAIWVSGSYLHCHNPRWHSILCP